MVINEGKCTDDCTRFGLPTTTNATVCDLKPFGSVELGASSAKFYSCSNIHEQCMTCSSTT